MVSIRYKSLKGRKYLYAEKSVRLLDGRSAKFSKRIENKADSTSPQVAKYFRRCELLANEKSALRFPVDSILSKSQVRKCANYAVEYQQIMRKLSESQKKDLLDRFTVNFTYESNAIEGNSLTLKDVTLVLCENIVPRGKDLREIYEARNTRNANLLLFSGKIKMDIPSIIRLHKVLVEGTGIATGFKRFPNVLMMRQVKTTPPELVQSEMERLMMDYKRDKGKVHPLKLAAGFHSRFERIHPFDDGNGRVGRILVNAILLENKYPPVIIRKTMRESYFNALSAADSGHLDQLERFLLDKFKSTFEKFFQVYVKYL